MPRTANAANNHGKERLARLALILLLQCIVLSSSYTAVSPTQMFICLIAVTMLFRTAHYFKVWIP